MKNCVDYERKIQFLIFLILAFCLLLPVFSFGAIIETVAGTGVAGYDPLEDGGVATSAKLNRPWGVVVDNSGNLYVADYYNHLIRYVNPGSDGIVNGGGDETIVSVAGNGAKTDSSTNPLGDGGLATAGSLNAPLGIALDSNGNLFVADTFNNRIRIVTPGADGVVNGGMDETIDTLPGSDSLLNRPYGISFDVTGNLFIADTYNYCVRKWSPGLDGVVNGGGDEIVEIVAGSGIRTGSIDGEGGDPEDDLANSLKYPANIVVDASGVFYISDRGNNRILKGTHGSFNVYPSGTSTFSSPYGLDLDGIGNLYVAEFGSSKVQMINKEGTVTTVAGNGTRTGIEGGDPADDLGDGGEATVATLNFPTGVIVDNSGNIYVSDYFNNRIRWVEGSGSLVNNPPVADSQSVTATEDEPIPVTLSGSDSDGLITAYEIGIGPSHGFIGGVDANRTYTPDANFNGLDSFTYRVIDNKGSSSEWATVNISVSNINDVPVITEQISILSTGENTPLNLSLPVLSVADPDNLYPDDFTLIVLDGTDYTLNSNTITPKASFIGTMSVPVRVFDGTDYSNTFNLDVTVAPLPKLLDIASLVNAGGTHTGQIKSTGSLWTWGNNATHQLGYDTGYNSLSLDRLQVGSDVDWARMSFGSKHSVALKADGSLWGWGDNSKGQLGDSTYNSVSVPTRIGEGYDWTAVSAGWDHTLALKSDGTLWAWGYNLKGQLGLGDTIDRNVPTQVEVNSFDPATPWTAVMAGPTYSLALKADGTLWGWGDDWHGQLGQGASEDYFLLPVQVDSLDAPGVIWTDMAAGYSHVLALDSNGHLWAWGDGDFGQLGDGASGDANVRLTPQEISTDIWTSVAAGYDFSAALKTGGTLWTWGANDWGQLGTGGGIGFFESTPGQVGTATDWIDIDCGNAHIAALHSDETVETWGSNQNGQLGDGTLNDTVSRGLTIDPVTSPTNLSTLSVGGTVTETGLPAGTTVTVELSHTDLYGTFVLETFASTFDEATGTWSATVNFSDDSEYALTVTAENTADIYKAQAREYIVFDSTPSQSPSVSSAAAATRDRQPLWSWSGDAVDGSGTFRFQLDTSVFDPTDPGSSATSYQPAVPLDDGGHTLYVQERDEAGNWSASGSFTILVDNVPPAAPLVVSAVTVTNNSPPTWTWSSGGGGNGHYRSNLDGGAWSAESADTIFTSLAPLTEGSHILEVQERDAAGNWSDSGSFTVEVDLTPPWLADFTADSPTNADSQQISGQIDSDATLNVTVDTAATANPLLVSGGQWLYQISGLVTGQNVITATATDPAGNVTVKTAIIYLNSAPTVASAIPDQSATEDAPFIFAVPSGTFDDLDGDSLALSATLSDGSPLPAWLGFAGSDFSGTPGNDDVGAISVKVTATDPHGLAASDVFVLTVSNVNDAPVISGQVALSMPEDTSLTITFTDLFVTDPDNSYPAGFSLTVQDGANYGVNGATITPAADFTGILTVPVLVNDGTDDSNTFNLSVEVSAINDAPVISGQNALITSEDTSLTIALADLIVTDPDNSYPSGFSLTVQPGANYGVNGATITPAADFNGPLTVPVFVNDGTDDSSKFNLSVEVSAVNDAPTIGGTPYATAVPGQSYSFIPVALDVDAGDSLTFSINLKPDWATFDTTSGKLSGTPTDKDAGTTTSGIEIAVTDGSASAKLTSLDLTVRANAAPTISGDPHTTAVPGQPYSFVPEAADGDREDDGHLSFSIEKLPSWAGFNPATGELSGTPSATDAGTPNDIKIMVTDSAGDSDFLSFTLTVRDNVAPVITSMPNETAIAGDYYSFTPDASDQDNESLSYSIANKPSWATFQLSNGSLTGTPGTADARLYPDITITVTDSAGAEAVLKFDLTVEENHPPLISGTPLATAVVRQEYSFTPVPFDQDPGDTLTFAINLIPTWASFSEESGTLTGIPQPGDVGMVTEGIMISVTDSFGGTAQLPVFNLTVVEVNNAPTISGTPLTTAVPGRSYMFRPVADDADADEVLTFSIENPPGWAAFDENTGLLTGSPTDADTGTTEGIVITVTDSAGASASLPAFDLTVRSNETPTVANPLPDQSMIAWVDKAFTFKIPEGTFADDDLSVPEFNESLTLTASLADGSALPEWLDFLSSDPEFWGTPFNDDFGTLEIMVTATDAAGDKASVTFILRVGRIAAVQGAAVEWGTIEVNEGKEVHIPLANDYVEPVVMARPLTSGNEWGLVRLDNVTSDGFDAVYKEPYGSGTRVLQIFYLVADKGVRNLGGLTLQAGTLETDALLPSWQTVSFTQPFSEVPAVFTSVQTTRDIAPALIRIQDCTKSGFGTVMQDPEAAVSHGTENLGWIAIEKGLGRTSDGRSVLVSGGTATSDITYLDIAHEFTDYFSSIAVSEKFARLFPILTEAIGSESYTQSFESHVPILIGDMNTTFETDPAILHFRNRGMGSVETFIQETKGGGTPHALEDFSIFLGE